MKKIKRIIVTGASRGIGFEIAKNLLQSGFEVHMIARQKEGLISAKKKLQKFGNVSYSVIDLSKKEKISFFCKQWSNKIYGLVNNAGIWAEERLDDIDYGIWDPIMKLNLEGLYFLTKGLQKYIINSGRIINISSQLGTSGRAGMGIYSASKHAVIGLTKCWALELGNRQITVNAVCPGWINTESNRIEINKRANEIVKSITLHRFIEPEEVSNLVGFLVGSTGSGITGQIYEIK